MPLQSQALKALSTRYADGHPLETCGLHLKKEKKERKKKKEKLPQQQIREAAARREGEKEGGRPVWGFGPLLVCVRFEGPIDFFTNPFKYKFLRVL